MKTEIGSALKKLRKNENFTQQEIADYLGIGRTMYRRYETGEIEIPIHHLKRLCLLYHVSSDSIIGLPEDQNKC